MKFKNTGAQKSTITRDVNDFLEKTDNIFKAVSVMAKRSNQINEKIGERLTHSEISFEGEIIGIVQNHYSKR